MKKKVLLVVIAMVAFAIQHVWAQDKLPYDTGQKKLVQSASNTHASVRVVFYKTDIRPIRSGTMRLRLFWAIQTTNDADSLYLDKGYIPGGAWITIDGATRHNKLRLGEFSGHSGTIAFDAPATHDVLTFRLRYPAEKLEAVQPFRLNSKLDDIEPLENIDLVKPGLATL